MAQRMPNASCELRSIFIFIFVVLVCSRLRRSVASATESAGHTFRDKSHNQLGSVTSGARSECLHSEARCLRGLCVINHCFHLAARQLPARIEAHIGFVTFSGATALARTSNRCQRPILAK